MVRCGPLVAESKHSTSCGGKLSGLPELNCATLTLSSFLFFFSQRGGSP